MNRLLFILFLFTTLPVIGVENPYTDAASGCDTCGYVYRDKLATLYRISRQQMYQENWLDALFSLDKRASMMRPFIHHKSVYFEQFQAEFKEDCLLRWQLCLKITNCHIEFCRVLIDAYRLSSEEAPLLDLLTRKIQKAIFSAPHGRLYLWKEGVGNDFIS